MTAFLMLVFVGLCAFAVDVGNWYLVGQRAQRAADAAALAGVTSLPGDQTTAFSTAQKYSTLNGFANGGRTTVTTAIDGRPTRLRVNVSREVDNFFGPLLGMNRKTITRTAVADYAGPVPMGSPCNAYGSDPIADSNRSSNCDATGAFWANVGSPAAPKGNGDAFQNSMGSNSDFDPNGYFYGITVTKPMSSLTIEAFDPALIAVGDLCDANNLDGAEDLSVSKTAVTDPSTRYANGASSLYCTGDVRYGGTGEVRTQFTVRDPGVNPWDPLSFPVRSGCTKQFDGYNGDLERTLDKTRSEYTARPDVAANFRRWVNLCTITGVTPGTYLIQVKTNGLGRDSASGHNRFSLRAYGASSSDNDSIAVAGFEKMAMYGNTPNGTSKFYLARVPTGARGQLLNVHLFDIGDGAKTGSTVKVLPPSETSSTPFSNCTGFGVQTGSLTNCTINVSGSYNGKWQQIQVPIPTTYSCDDASQVGCWVRLEFYYGAGSNPNDTTSWTASIEGDPVRLVE
jgi:Flp pilus assembly protein TadG